MKDIKIGKYIDYFLIAPALLIIFGALVYRLYALNTIGVLTALFLSVVSFIIILHIWRKSNQNNKYFYQNKQNTLAKNQTRQQKFSLLLIILFAVFTLTAFFILFSARTTESIVSPWQVVTPYFFLFYTSSAITLFFWLYKKYFRIYKSKYLPLIFISIQFFLTFSIVAIIYKLGFGFDGFIHKATIDIINKQGYISPKPFYYLGYYALLIFLHKIFFLPIGLSNTWLVPAFSALILPLMFYRSLKYLFPNNKNIYLLIFFLPLLPFSFLTSSTPQQLAYLFVLLSILRSIICDRPWDLFVVFVLSATAMAIHPLAGIPTFFFALFLAVFVSDRQSLKPHFYRLIFLLSALCLPLIFLFLEKNNGTENTSNATSLWPKNEITNFLSNIKLNLPHKENVILNTVYFFAFNYRYFIILLVLVGFLITKKYKKECAKFKIYAYSSLSLLLSFFILQQFDFSYLIYYERGNYTARILLLALLFLLPYLLLTGYSLFVRLNNLKKPPQYIFYTFLLALLPLSLYLNYPRFDNYHNSRGYSVGAADMEAVNWIEQDTMGDYIVLANQQVSAAALKQFGFAHYYTTPKSKNSIFYYPLPTSSPLYQYYLDMVYKKPSRKTMAQAMDLAQVSTGYFVLNKYWWAFPKILNEAKLSTNEIKVFHNKEIYVFKYQK